MPHTDPRALDDQTDEQRTTLLSVDVFTRGWGAGWPLLLGIGSPHITPPWANALTLGACLLWVVTDLVVYLLRNKTLPERSEWAAFNRVSVPLFFGLMAFSAVKVF